MYINFNKICFGSGDIRFLASSDNHGHSEKHAKEIGAIKRNRSKIFSKTPSQSDKLCLVHGGDLCIDPNRRNFDSLDKKRGEVIGDKQIKAYNHFRKRVREISQQPNLRTFFVPGNHDLESWGADGLLKRIPKVADKILLSNVDIKNSSSITSLSPYEQRKFKPYSIVSVKDSEDPKIMHKAVIIGLTPANIEFYCKGKTNGLSVMDKRNSDGIKKGDILPETYIAINDILSEAKKKYPNSPVILVSHTGKTAVEGIIDHLQTGLHIDAVINAHDHFDKDDSYRGVPVLSLSQNGNMLKLLKIHFDKDGKFKIGRRTLKTQTSKPDKQTEAYYERSLKRDLRRNISVTGNDLSGTISEKDVRYNNNAIANTITDTILRELNTGNYDINTPVDVFVMRRSAFRSSLPIGNKVLSNMELSSLTSGLTEDDSKIFTGVLSGALIAELLFENIKKHGNDIETQTRNPMFAFSGIKFNKTGIYESNSTQEAAGYVEIKSNGIYVPLDLNGKYNVAFTKKMRDKVLAKKVCTDSFQDTKTSVTETLRKQIKSNGNKLFVSNDTRVTK